MPAKAKSRNSGDESAPNEAPTATLTAAPMDAPPSFLEKSEAAPAEQIAHGERSNLQLYLQEIGKTALLTIEEEVQLARRIRRGDKAARDHMISANLRLVVKIAMDYKDFGLPLLSKSLTASAATCSFIFRKSAKPLCSPSRKRCNSPAASAAATRLHAII